MDYFHYNEWDEEELQEVLHKVGWEQPGECVTTWRADCELEEIKNTLFQYLYGMTHVDVFLSNLIREGKISRNDALEKQKTESFSIKRLKKVLLKLELSENFMEGLYK